MRYYVASESIETATSVGDCYKKCANDTKCKFWSFLKTATSRTDNCWLSASFMCKNSDVTHISGTMDCKWSKLINIEMQALLI